MNRTLKPSEKIGSAWYALNWKRSEKTVFKMQQGIDRASQGGDGAAVRKLERLLQGSWSAKRLAVRKVTQDNGGKRTAGVHPWAKAGNGRSSKAGTQTGTGPKGLDI